MRPIDPPPKERAMQKRSFISKARRVGILTAATAGCLLYSSNQAQAVNGTWTFNGSNTWTVASNWVSGAIPNVSGAVADFSTLDLTSDLTVTLNGNKTVSALIF